MPVQGWSTGLIGWDGSVLKRTMRPSLKIGSIIGLPASRSSVNWVCSGLKPGAPANSAPFTRLARSNSPLKLDSIEYEPRLSPEISSFGRVGAGREIQCSYTASNRARPASAARSLSTTTEAHDGR